MKRILAALWLALPVAGNAWNIWHGAVQALLARTG